jgi:hypothetical protein
MSRSSHLRRAFDAGEPGRIEWARIRRAIHRLRTWRSDSRYAHTEALDAARRFKLPDSFGIARDMAE